MIVTALSTCCHSLASEYRVYSHANRPYLFI